jgi:hypothetical protein
MTQVLKFDAVKVSKLEEDFRKIELDSQTRNMIKNAGKLLGQYVPLSEMAIMGNGWYSLQEWQVQNKTHIFEAIMKDPSQFVRIMKELMDIGKRRMKKLLENPEEQDALLDEAFDKVLEFWGKNSKFMDPTKK